MFLPWSLASAETVKNWVLRMLAGGRDEEWCDWSKAAWKTDDLVVCVLP